MGSGIMAILQFTIFTLLATAGISIVITVFGYLYGAIVEQGAKVEETRVKIARLSRLVSGFQDRLDRRTNEAAGAASGLFSAQRQERTLKARIRELEQAGHRFVRLVGEEKSPNQHFEILAMNTSVSHQVKRGEKHPFFDSSWARPQPIHIWAEGMDEAKEKFEQTFSKTVGFKLIHIQLAHSESVNRFLAPKPSSEDAELTGEAAT